MALESSKFIDIHYHANYDLYKRRYSAFEAGKAYKKLGGAVVLKSHLGSTVEVANELRSEGLPIYGSIVLNKICGGIDYRQVLRALALHQPNGQVSLLVHLPTITGRHHQSKLKRSIVEHVDEKELLSPETISNEQTKLKSEVLDILKLSLDYPIAISSGHASRHEIDLLIEASYKLGVKKLLLNQPANPLSGLTFEDLLLLSKYDFLWFEQTALTLFLDYQSKEDFQKVITYLPRVIYSSDLGQTSQMNIEDWYKKSLNMFTECGIDSSRQEQLFKNHPKCFLSY